MSATRLLKSADAATFLAPFAEDFARKGKRLGLDVDREVLTSGRNGSGAAVFPGRRCDFAELADERGSTFIDGDLVADGWVENAGGLVFVRGNLITHSLFNSGYLIVAGELRVARLLGDGERYGTFVFGDASVTSAVLARGHHFDVWGECTLGESSDEVKDVDEARAALRTWAQAEGRLPEDWANRRWAPRSPAVVVPPPVARPPERAAVLVELEAWFGRTTYTQREQLGILRAKWLARIGPDEREEATRIIRRAVNSKKLIEERDELLRTLV